MNHRRKQRTDEAIAKAMEEDYTWEELRDKSALERISNSKQEKDSIVVKPLTRGQEYYFKAIETSVVTICSGPAGSGKTWIACYYATKYLKEGKIDKIIITRPLVSCGKGYGYRPGTVLEKVMPVMRPMIDALEEFLGKNMVDKYIENGTIELYPLDDMRGSSNKRSFIVCDEAQNAEFEQLHMLLTRVDKGTTLVICGDVTQNDLVHHGMNPLAEAMGLLRKHDVVEVSQVFLTEEDIVRNGFIAKVNRAFAKRAKGFDFFEDINLVVKGDNYWRKVKCPKCKENNWFNNGDENDSDSQDAESVHCWNCNLTSRLKFSDNGVDTTNIKCEGECIDGAAIGYQKPRE